MKIICFNSLESRLSFGDSVRKPPMTQFWPNTTNDSVLAKHLKWLRNVRNDKTVLSHYMRKGKCQKCQFWLKVVFLTNGCHHKRVFHTVQWFFLPVQWFPHRAVVFPTQAVVFYPGSGFSTPGSGYPSRTVYFLTGQWLSQPDSVFLTGQWF